MIKFTWILGVFPLPEKHGKTRSKHAQNIRKWGGAANLHFHRVSFTPNFSEILKISKEFLENSGTWHIFQLGAQNLPLIYFGRQGALWRDWAAYFLLWNRQPGTQIMTSLCQKQLKRTVFRVPLVTLAWPWPYGHCHLWVSKIWATTAPKGFSPPCPFWGTGCYLARFYSIPFFKERQPSTPLIMSVW